jgi:ankyrin repeat protein
MTENDHYIQDNMFEMLEMVSVIHNDLFIRTVQFEIVKIIVDEYTIKENVPWDDYLQHTFRRILTKLFKNRRIDIIKYIWDRLKSQEFFNEPNHLRRCVDEMTSNQLDRRYFCMIMVDTSLDSLLSKQRLIFILLDKKERKLLEKLLKLSPDLINELDEDGNDPLLYICLKVYGCRHRIIEFLIKMGSDLERRNLNGQNFMETLQLQRNQKLFQKLIEHEIIKIDV